MQLSGGFRPLFARLFDDLGLHVAGHLLVAVELLGVHPLALSHRTQACCVAVDLSQGHLGLDDLEVAINLGFGHTINPLTALKIENNKVVALETTPLSIKIGPPVKHQRGPVSRRAALGVERTPLQEPVQTESGIMVLDMDGGKGQTLEASGDISLNVFGFFHVSGHFAFVKKTETITIYDPATQERTSDVEVDVMTVGIGGVNAFVGVNGPYWTDLNDNGVIDGEDTDGNGLIDPDESDELNGSSLGLSLIDVNFALALMKVPKPVPQDPDAPDIRSF